MHTARHCSLCCMGERCGDQDIELCTYRYLLQCKESDCSSLHKLLSDVLLSTESWETEEMMKPVQRRHVICMQCAGNAAGTGYLMEWHSWHLRRCTHLCVWNAWTLTSTHPRWDSKSCLTSGLIPFGTSYRSSSVQSKYYKGNMLGTATPQLRKNMLRCQPEASFQNCRTCLSFCSRSSCCEYLATWRSIFFWNDTWLYTRGIRKLAIGLWSIPINLNWMRRNPRVTTEKGRAGSDQKSLQCSLHHTTAICKTHPTKMPYPSR